MQKESMWDGYQYKLPANQRQDLLGQTADNLLILGAGSFGQVIREIAEAMDYFGEIVFLDDDPELGSGPLADYKKLRSKFRYAYAAFGKNDLRSKWMNHLKAAGYVLPTLIHPTAVISPSAILGQGVSVLPKACIHTNASIGAGSIIGLGVLIDHDVLMGNYSLIQTGSVVAAHCTLPGFISTKPGAVIKEPVHSDEFVFEVGV